MQVLPSLTEFQNRPAAGALLAALRNNEDYQLRYLYFLDPSAKERLTVPIIPFARIKELGATMYRGQAISSLSRPSEQTD